MAINRFFIIALAIIVIAANTAHAEDTGQAMFKLGGFGTLGASHSSEKKGDYVLDGTQPKGAGLSKNWSMDIDSRLGVQASADFTPQIKAVLQVISEYQYDSSYRPAVEWANVKYAFTPNFNIRAGRIALPTFLNSDTRKVGYSYPWVRPPVDLYRQLAITNSDGVDATYRFHVGEATNTVKAVYGRNTIDRPTSTSTAKGLWGVFDTAEYGQTTFRVGYQEREASSLNRLTGVTGAWVRNSDLSAGAIYDPGDWFVTGEWIQRKSTFIKEATYVSAGLRVDNFTPYLTYGKDTQPSFLPNAHAPSAASIQLAMRSQKTVSFGTRWDFARSADLKLQYDLVKLSDNSNGYLANVPAATTLYGAKFHVFSVDVDFVF